MKALFIEKDGKTIRPPTTTVEGHNVEIKGSLKYLGITFDRKLNFNEHVRKKTEKIANKMEPAVLGAAGVEWHTTVVD